LIASFERFKSVILDFKGANKIGQAFADKWFRVYRMAHPALVEKMTTIAGPSCG
jgi:hypothetical protein